MDCELVRNIFSCLPNFTWGTILHVLMGVFIIGIFLIPICFIPFKDDAKIN